MSTIQAGGSRVRAGVWAFHLVLPLVGLWLLLAQPQIDVHWQHDPSHFWMVLAVAAVSVLVGARINEAARAREDARLFLVSMAFVASAAFLFLHALATPGMIVSAVTSGFHLATPFGLLLAAVFAAVSALPFTPAAGAAVIRRQGLLRGALAVLAVAWGAASLLELPPLGSPSVEGTLGETGIAVMGVTAGLYAFAAARYYLLHRQRPAVMLLSVLTAWVLLAEAAVAVGFSEAWRLSWWEWHLLMAAAFGYVAYSAHVQYRKEGTGAGLFDGIAMGETVRRIRAEYGEALETYVEELRRQEETGGAGPTTELVLEGLARRLDLTEGQVRVLGRAGEALAAERDQARRLGALVAIGSQASVDLGETELLRAAVGHFADSLGRDRLRVGLVTDGRLTFPPELRTAAGWTAEDDAAAEAVVREAAGGGAAASGAGGVPQAGGTGEAVSGEVASQAGGAGALVLPLTVKEHLAGVLQVSRPERALAERDRALLLSMASQLSIALENTRLYRQIDVLFRQFMSPDVVTNLLADPGQAKLGGALVDVTALFADLRGFTTFSERVEPAEIVAMLNRYHSVTVPQVLSEGGTVVQFVGDALMALFNAPARQSDHALRAARCALAIQNAIAEIGAEADEGGWPRFRIGVNTGRAVVGNIGSDELRNFNAMGDAVNVAARLESVAQPGQVVIGKATLDAIGERAVVEPLGDLELKGKEEAVTAFVLTALRDAGT